MSQLTRTRTAHEVKLESISKSVREVEHKSREGFFDSETGEAAGGQSKVSEDLPEHVRDMRDTLKIAFGRSSHHGSNRRQVHF